MANFHSNKFQPQVGEARSSATSRHVDTIENWAWLLRDLEAIRRERAVISSDGILRTQKEVSHVERLTDTPGVSELQRLFSAETGDEFPTFSWVKKHLNLMKGRNSEAGHWSLDRFAAELNAHLTGLSASVNSAAKENPLDSSPLTESQASVLKFVKEHPGKAGKEIADALDLNKGTVSKIVGLLRPWGLKNRRGYGYYVDNGA